VNFIKTYEGFEIGDFKTFLDKYRKKGYISKTDMKRMDSTDLKSEYFNRINNKVDSCLEFFNRNDFDLLSDLLLDVYDEFPTINSSKVNYSFSLSIEDKTTTSNTFTIPVSIMTGAYSYDPSFWDPSVNKYHTNLRGKEDLIDGIISRIVDNRKRSISEEEERKKKQIERRPGVRDFWSSYQLRNLTNKNPYQNLIINPVLTFDIKLDSDMDYGWGTPGANEKYEMIRQFEKLSEPQMKRYFSAIGYDSYFRVSNDGNYSNNQFLRFNISLSIS
jgi:hypothetical protein